MTPKTASLAVSHLTKRYPGVLALNDFSLSFFAGEVHALVGENGAGKSTLIKAVTGAIEPDEGTIQIGDQEFSKMTPAISRSNGIEAIYQDCQLFPTLSAAENIFFDDRESPLPDRKRLNRMAEAVFASFNIDIDPAKKVEELSSAQMQIIAIAKATTQNARVIIMDEPTAPLTEDEVEVLFGIIHKLRKNDITVIYISHRLEEIFRISDRVTVMRDGNLVKTLDTKDTMQHELISLMVGHELNEQYPARNNEIGSESLRLEDVCTESIRNISFSARRGEILGISGLVGSGRTEILRAIYGLDPLLSGQIFIDNAPVTIRSPQQAIEHGIGIIPEDRKKQGFFMEMDVSWNISFNSIRKLCRGMILRSKAIAELSQRYCDLLRIRTPSLEQKAKFLSGGNQQKVVLAKTLAANSDIILFDEPTSGIDVGAKQEIYTLMNELAAEGKTIVMVSSDMEEILGMADRLVVMYEGKLAGELPRERFSKTEILNLASGLQQQALMDE